MARVSTTHLSRTQEQVAQKAVIDNPALADWFLCHRVQKFVDAFYIGILGATDYWMRQHHGSPHVHSLAWLPNAPDVEKLLTSAETFDTVKEEIIQYADKVHHHPR